MKSFLDSPPFPFGSTYHNEPGDYYIAPDVAEHLVGVRHKFGQVDAVLVRSVSGKPIRGGDKLLLADNRASLAEFDDPFQAVADPTLWCNVPCHDLFWAWLSWPDSLREEKVQ